MSDFYFPMEQFSVESVAGLRILHIRKLLTGELIAALILQAA